MKYTLHVLDSGKWYYHAYTELSELKATIASLPDTTVYKVTQGPFDVTINFFKGV